MADLLGKVEGATIRFTRAVAFLGLLALLTLAAIVMANALSRWLFVFPLEGVRDWMRLIIAVAVGSCLPAVLAMRQNITVRFLGNILPGRTASLFDLFGAVVTLVVFAALAWQIQDYAGELLRDGEITENIGMPVAPWWFVVAALFWLSVLVQVFVVIAMVAELTRGTRPRGPAPDESHPAEV